MSRLEYVGVLVRDYAIHHRWNKAFAARLGPAVFQTCLDSGGGGAKHQGRSGGELPILCSSVA
jgi:hypothetical protein